MVKCMRCLYSAPLNLMSLILLHSEGSINSNPDSFHDKIMAICVYLHLLGLILFFRVEYIYFQNMQTFGFNSQIFSFLSGIVFTATLSLKVKKVFR